MSTTLYMYRGDDRDFTVTLTENAVPIDLTGYSLRSMFRADIDDAAAVFTLSTTDSSITIDIGSEH